MLGACGGSTLDSCLYILAFFYGYPVEKMNYIMALAR